jgi:hypothetical protein
MKTEKKIENKLELTQEPEDETRPTWHAPSLIRIDIKRTLLDIGSGSDGVGRTTLLG